MVSGLVTSPCDQLRIFSGDARLMRIASKSAIGFAMSKGLERYKVFLRFLRVLTRPLTALDFSSQFPVLSSQFSENPARTLATSAAPRANAAVAHISKISLGAQRPQFPLSFQELGTENCLPSPLLPAARAPQVSSRPLPP